MITFPEPIGFTAAENKVRAADLMPNDLSSAELGRIDRAKRVRSIFSARMINTVHVQGVQDLVDQVVSGKINEATARVHLKDLLDATGYAPKPGEEGTIKDFGTNARINLIIGTNVQMAFGYGQAAQSNTPGARRAFPAQELIRFEDRKVPREWFAIWDETRIGLGDATSATEAAATQRMVALKGDPIWEAISDFGVPYPPFKYKSGMGVRPIGRRETVQLGVMRSADPTPAAQDLEFNDGLEASIEDIDAELADVLEQSLGPLAQKVGDKLRLVDPGALKNRVVRVLAFLNANPNQPHGPDGRFISKQEIGDMFDRAATHKQSGTPALAYRAVDASEAKRIKEATGLDVAGYHHAVGAQDLQHIVKTHGSEKTEKPRVQLAVTRADLEKLPETIATADLVRLGRKTTKGLDTIEYIKHDGGTTYVVEEVRTGRGQLALKTFYKRKNRVVINAADKSTAFSQSSKTGRATLEDIPPLGLRQYAHRVLAMLDELEEAA